MKKFLTGAFFLFAATGLFAQNIETKFNNNEIFDKIGKGLCVVENGELKTKNAYAAFGDISWKNYQFSFTATTPSTQKEVQIWSGFRAADRDDKYVLGLKGGIENDLYLARLGYMGADDYLALRHIDFPLKTGIAYTIKIQVAGQRIRVFLNNEKLPRIDIVDKHNENNPSGKIILGGGWLETDFQHFSVKPLAANALDNVPREEYAPVPVDKEKLRKAQRASYAPVVVSNINEARTQISLNGKWLFMPGYEAKNDEAAKPSKSDNHWHVMHVPDFWNPDHVWLFGEMYGDVSKGVSDSYFQKEEDRCNAYTFDYKKTNIGWYRQWVELPQSIKGKHIELSFDAVSKVAEVWVNGKKAGNHVGMFGAFNVDVTKLLKPGKNLIAVKVYRDYIKNIQDADKIVGVAVSEEVTQKMLKDLPHGFLDDDPAGIWQPVSLIITNPLHITDVFIKPNLQGADFNITIKNSSSSQQQFSVNTAIHSIENNGSLFNGTNVKSLTLQPNEERIFSYSIDNLHPELWSPAHPNLYNFLFSLTGNNDKTVYDNKLIRSGFKIFTTKNGYLYLNGKPYWLRGANQTAMPLAPNDTALANKFTQLMHAGNMEVTRTHTVPYTETWMDAADKYGAGISYEGTWPWLMLDNSPIPDKKLLDIWANEFYDLIKKYRNHPSLMIWTMNNEMKFYGGDPDKERAMQKMKIISDVVRHIRKIDSTHVICFDSNYFRWAATKRFGQAFMDSIDDGDIDDVHQYTNWYDDDIFSEFNGRFQKIHKYPGRPLISQEMSTGYPDETGHSTRFYTLVHQNPSSLVGKFAYSYNDPKYFMTSQSFISKELAEALRRYNPEASGVLHFSLATWFSKVYSASDIKPQLTYYRMKKALQPVLVSAELWGRHFYAGDTLPLRVCVVNDDENAQDIPASTLQWQLTDKNGKTFAQGTENFPAVKYYGRQWISLAINIPANLPSSRTDGKLILKLVSNNKLLSENDYDLLFARHEWARASNISNIVVLDKSGKLLPVLNDLKLKYTTATSLTDALQHKGVLLLSGFDQSNTSQSDIASIRKYIDAGGKVLITGKDDIAPQIFPKDIRNIIPANPQIVNMEIPESPVFKGLQPLDIRYFNDDKNEAPSVCFGAYQINRNANVEALASSVKIHGYLSGSLQRRSATLDKIKGFPIVQITEGEGMAILSTMEFEKGITDPVAEKLLSNILAYLSK
ncbi:glycosyl hydrolase family 2 [Arachidicoccus ginsenosidimutans]|uniref:glycoside hydrolase family 2 protein n=1 Tax=Arachidicoccus sp. BS20 TaxID=1850526 RepID=UPI0007F13818|nr:glycoside hydrolase family 2 [Arachidicoccus sp. BS20]ANI89982.1 glycosyl hydrolase family 2 [Arachidicoccus sp. BS20]